jgi:hypothetical protein
VTGSIFECFVDDAEAFSIRAYDHPTGVPSIEPADAVVEVEELTVRTLAPDFSGVSIRASTTDAAGRD